MAILPLKNGIIPKMPGMFCEKPKMPGSGISDAITGTLRLVFGSSLRESIPVNTVQTSSPKRNN